MRGVRVVLLEVAGCCGSSRRGTRRSTGRRRRRRTARPAARRAPGRRRTQLAHQHVLRVVGVLVLVDQHVPEPPPVVLGDVGERLQQVDRRHDQVVEVERVGLAQPPLVERVGLGERLLDVRLGPAGERLVVDQLVLEVAHLVGERPRRVALRVEVEVAADQRHQPLRVGLVVDREGRLHARAWLGLAAQDPHAGRVERATPTSPWPRPPTRAATRSFISPAALLVKVIARTAPGLHLALAEQVGDPVGQHPGLARAGAGHDEQRAALVHDRGPLLRVEPLEQGRGAAAALGPLPAALGSRRRAARGQREGVVEEGAHLFSESRRRGGPNPRRRRVLRGRTQVRRAEPRPSRSGRPARAPSRR